LTVGKIGVYPEACPEDRFHWIKLPISALSNSKDRKTKPLSLEQPLTITPGFDDFKCFGTNDEVAPSRPEEHAASSGREGAPSSSYQRLANEDKTPVP